MDFQPDAYGQEVARILARDGGGNRQMPLAPRACSSAEVRAELVSLSPRGLFRGARSPEGAMAGLYLYFSCLDEAHSIAQDLNTLDGSFWHAILHRQEPDAFNSGYWFRQTGRHPVFPALCAAARDLGYDSGSEWDPVRFIDYCEDARKRPGSAEERLAMRVQLAEWQLLFDHCAKTREKTS